MQTCKVVVFSMRQLEFETEAVAPSPAARHGDESTHIVAILRNSSHSTSKSMCINKSTHASIDALVLWASVIWWQSGCFMHLLTLNKCNILCHIVLLHCLFSISVLVIWSKLQHIKRYLTFFISRWLSNQHIVMHNVFLVLYFCNCQV